MRLLFLFFILSFFSQKTLGQSIIAVQEERFLAIVQQDSLVLFRLVAEDLHYIHSNGVVENKQSHINAILSKKIVYQSFICEEEPSVSQKGKVQFIHGKVKVKGLYTGTPYAVQLLFTAVYTKKKKQWQLYRWQSTKI